MKPQKLTMKTIGLSWYSLPELLSKAPDIGPPTPPLLEMDPELGVSPPRERQD
jgi:hypothetical protein